MTWILIAVGGGVGAAARHALNTFVHAQFGSNTFPTGILIVNVLGSLIIGLLAGGIAASKWAVSADLRAFLFAGMLGGFTTFSSFSLDTLTLIRSGQAVAAAFNVGAHVVLGLLAVGVGYRIGSIL